MGVYDEYGTLGGQIKVGSCELTHFLVGSKVDIPDGVYITLCNVVVIVGGVFVAEFETLTDKWGGAIEPQSVLHNPLADVVEAVVTACKQAAPD